MISMAVEAYMIDQGHAPRGETLAEIRGVLEPVYIGSLVLEDGWGNAFLYRHGRGEDKLTYLIASAGKDGKFSGFDQRGRYPVVKIEDFSRDIIFSNGSFVFGPENH
jgi:hypothetical protein